MRKSLGRRMALRRPSEAEIEQLEAELAAAEAENPRRRDEGRGAAHAARAQAAAAPHHRLHRSDRSAYNRFERVPKPTTQAVMFCLMDASASMTEPLKDLAKRFFMLLHVFLTRYYREVHIVFIRHTSTAAEVDEETFFRGTETGGTVISTALDEMLKVVRERYSPADWNIYAAQASDGDNFHDDMPRCLELLDEEILPVCQYFAYIETAHGERFNDTVETPVWHGYTEIARRRAQLRHAAGGGAGGHLPGVPRAVLGERRRQPEGGRFRVGHHATKKLPKRKGNMRPLFDGAEWTFELIRKVYDTMGEIALGELGLDIYPNQIEVITAEQMLDSYSSIGMPLMYRHWSFGKRFARDEAYYKRGMRSLAYELVINSDPCISYVMEENSMTMQALVLAHAAYGHNHFFKNNYQFQMWTQPDHIIDYLAFAKTLRGRVRGALRPGRRRERARCRARADEPGRQPRPAAPRRATSPSASRRKRHAAGRTRRRPTTTSTARCPRSRASALPSRPRRRTSSAGSACPRRTCSISWRRTRPSSRTGSASCCASCACCRSTSIRSARPR